MGQPYGIRSPRPSETTVTMWRHHGFAAVFKPLFALVVLAGCSTGVIQIAPLQQARGTGVGYVAGDEPRAVMAGREILSLGGSAADAAVATAFSLSVTLQSSAGLGGGGLCLVYDAGRQTGEVIDFSPAPAVGRADLARWQSAVPTLPRGLFALHAKHGRLAWQTVVSPAETIARFGHTASRQLAEDLLKHSDILVNDPNALDTFMSSRRTLVKEGERLDQLELSATLAQIRGRTPADFYSGNLSRQIDAQAETTGLSISSDDLREYAPVWRDTSVIVKDGVRILVASYPSEIDRISSRLADPSESKETELSPSGAGATGFVIQDGAGNAVACSLTMLRPFGIGVMPQGAGFLAAPNPEFVDSDIASAIALIGILQSSATPRFVIASGGRGASTRVAESVMDLLGRDNEIRNQVPQQRGQRPFVNQIACNGGAARASECSVKSDPLGFGYGVFAEDEK